MTKVRHDEVKDTERVPRVQPSDPNAQIAKKLHAFYHSVQEEAVPQRFLDLLEKLDAVEQSMHRAE